MSDFTFKKSRLTQIGKIAASFMMAIFLFRCTIIEIKPNPTIVSSDFYNDVLFISTNSVQVETSEPATFQKLSTTPNFEISSSGLITHSQINGLNEIEATWQDGSKKKFYVIVSQPLDKINFLQGWKNIEKLYKTDTTYAIVIRHAEAIVGIDQETYSASTGWWKSCDSKLARQLSENGILQSKTYGKIFKALKMPVKQIFSSEFCRSKQTAELMELGLPVKIDNRINGHFYNVSGMLSQDGMLRILEEQSKTKQLLLISAHHDISRGIQQMRTYDMADTFLMKVGADKVSTFQGVVTYPMWKILYEIKGFK